MGAGIRGVETTVLTPSQPLTFKFPFDRSQDNSVV
jgi:hypothetical protein